MIGTEKKQADSGEFVTLAAEHDTFHTFLTEMAGKLKAVPGVQTIVEGTTWDDRNDRRPLIHVLFDLAAELPEQNPLNFSVSVEKDAQSPYLVRVESNTPSVLAQILESDISRKIQDINLAQGILGGECGTFTNAARLLQTVLAAIETSPELASVAGGTVYNASPSAL